MPWPLRTGGVPNILYRSELLLIPLGPGSRLSHDLYEPRYHVQRCLKTHARGQHVRSASSCNLMQHLRQRPRFKTGYADY